MADQDPVMDQIKKQIDLQAAQGVDPKVRAAIGDAALASQKVVIADPYWSAVSFEPVITQPGGAGTIITYTFGQGNKATAFGYALNDSLQAAGFGAYFGNATIAETNIKERGTPYAGQTALVYGLSFVLDPSSDAALAQLLFPNISVVKQLNGGTDRRELGTLNFIPGSGGLYGAGISYIAPPSLPDAVKTVGAMSNGIPGRDNMMLFAEPWYWRPAGNTDTNLALVCTQERTVTVTATPRVAATGVQAFAPPATNGPPGSYVRGWFLLHSFQTSSRSSNQ